MEDSQRQAAALELRNGERGTRMWSAIDMHVERVLQGLKQRAVITNYVRTATMNPPSARTATLHDYRIFYGVQGHSQLDLIVTGSAMHVDTLKKACGRTCHVIQSTMEIKTTTLQTKIMDLLGSAGFRSSTPAT